MVDGRALEPGQWVWFGNRDAPERFEDGLIDGSIHQAAANGATGELLRHEVRVSGETTADPGEHREAPRISPKEPVAMGCGQGAIPDIPGHTLIKQALSRKGHRQVVRAPDERHANAVWIAFRGVCATLDSSLVVLRQGSLKLRIDQLI